MNMVRFLISEKFRQQYSKEFSNRLVWEQEQQEAAYEDKEASKDN